MAILIDVINILPQDGEAYLIENFIDLKTCDKWYKNLLNGIGWEQYEIRLFGRQIPQPRLSAWYGEPGTIYSYSGLTLTPKPYTSALQIIKSKVELTARTTFNSVLLNLYRTGTDSMGWHSDDEKELGNNPIIASLSLGASRTFVLKHKHQKNLQIKLNLPHGSLLLMQGSNQHHWLHSLPKMKTVVEPRINLTFRKIV